MRGHVAAAQGLRDHAQHVLGVPVIFNTLMAWDHVLYIFIKINRVRLFIKLKIIKIKMFCARKVVWGFWGPPPGHVEEPDLWSLY
jgi:hypothetical protein